MKLTRTYTDATTGDQAAVWHDPLCNRWLVSTWDAATGDKATAEAFEYDPASTRDRDAAGAMARGCAASIARQGLAAAGC